MNKPETYKQWRSEWRATLYEIGYICMEDEKQHQFAKTLHRLRHRALRIRKRLDAEREAFTKDYASALVEMVQSWKS